MVREWLRRNAVVVIGGFYGGAPGAVAESVGHEPRVREIMGSKTDCVKQTQWLKNVLLSLPTQVLGIIRIGQGLVGSVSG